jgi:hypothetical protein
MARNVDPDLIRPSPRSMSEIKMALLTAPIWLKRHLLVGVVPRDACERVCLGKA